MGLAGWLRLGMTLLLSLSIEDVQLNGPEVSALIRAESLYTEEMQELIKHGVAIEVELYVSLVSRSGSGEEFRQRRIRRKASYDYYDGGYILVTRYPGGEKRELFDSFEALHRRAADFGRIPFRLRAESGRRLLWFARLSLLPNPLIEEALDEKTDSLWNNQQPSAETVYEE